MPGRRNAAQRDYHREAERKMTLQALAHTPENRERLRQIKEGGEWERRMVEKALAYRRPEWR